MDYRPIGRKIKQYRERAHLSQEELAEQVDISRNFLSALERGVKAPSLETFVKICNALDASADIMLNDVMENGYQVKASLLAEQIDQLVVDDQERIFNVVEAMLK